MANKPKKRTKQCCACVAKDSETKLRGQDRGFGGAGCWLGGMIIFLKIVLALKSLWTVVPCLCILI